MAKITKKMEYDKFAKVCEYGKCITNSFGYGIVLHDGGDAILWRAYYSDGTAHTAQRWQEIKWSTPRNEDQEARPYFTIYGTRYYLDEFMRCA